MKHATTSKINTHLIKFAARALVLCAALASAHTSAAQPKQSAEVYGDIPDYGQYYLSPDFVRCGGGKIAVSARTGKAVLTLDGNGKVLSKIPLPTFSSGVDISKDGKTLFATLYCFNGKLLKIDAESGKTTAQADVGHFPRAPRISPDGKFVYICNQFKNIVKKFDAQTLKELGEAKAVRDPFAVEVSPDGKTLVIVNQLPEAKGGLYEENIAAAVNIADAETMQTVAAVNLPNGAINAQDAAISPDGKFAYITHIVARFNVPTTQVERGWINTNAVSIIDLKARSLLATVLIDDIELGAANPYGITLADDAKKIVVAQSGTHEICVIDRIEMHKRISAAYAQNKTPQAVAEAICNDLAFLSNIKKRVKLDGFGPRHVCAVGNRAFVGMYYSDTLNTVDLSNFDVKKISIGGNEVLNEVRKGDLFYHDASLCFQKWLSCITCHTEVRSDALNWDLLNDGIGNPKQSKSMLFSHFTPPSMITGVRKSAQLAVRKGIRFIQFTRRPEKDSKAIDKYLMSLRPIPSPHLADDGSLTESALRGEFIFNEAKCSYCHTGDYYTDMKSHDVGSGLNEYKNFKFDTPTLREVWRTAPYLYDGRAKTIFDMLRKFNKEDKHGKTNALSDQDLLDLQEYILSL